MKRLFLYLFLIFFTLQAASQAYDIRDLQIEGISIGDDFKSYFKIEEQSSMKKITHSKNLVSIIFANEKFKVYDRVQVSYTNPKNFPLKQEIVSVSGIMT